MTLSDSWRRCGAACARLLDRVTGFIDFIDRFCAAVQKLTRDILTEDDGQSFCGWRFGMFTGVVAATVFTGYQVFCVAHGVAPELLRAYAQSLGWIIGAGGAGLAAKQWSQGGTVPGGNSGGGETP